MKSNRMIRNNTSIYLLLWSAAVISANYLPFSLPLRVEIRDIQWLLSVGALYLLKFNWGRVVVSLAFGVLWQSLWLQLNVIPEHWQQTEISIIGYVADAPIHPEGYSRFDFVTNEIRYQDEILTDSLLIRLKDYSLKNQYEAGQTWHLKVKLKTPRGFQNPGSRFDYERYLFGSGIKATGYVTTIVSGPDSPTDIWVKGVSKLQSFRQRAYKAIQRIDSSGLIAALTVGKKEGISAQNWEIFQSTGTIHLMVISGLHVSLVGAMSGWAVFNMALLLGTGKGGLGPRYVAIISGLISAVAYSVVSGLALPTIRATIVLICGVLIFFRSKKIHSWNAVVFVLTLLLVCNPLAPLQNGFWLSFIAYSCLVLFVGNTKSVIVNDEATIKRYGNQVLQIFKIQWILFLCMAPLLIWMLGRVALVSPIANAVAVPVVALTVVPLSLMGLFCWSLGLNTFSEWIFTISTWVIEWLILALAWFARQDFNIVEVQPSSFAIVLLFGLAVLMLLMRNKLPGWHAGIWVVLPLIFPVKERLDEGVFKYTMLDVGHGLASVIETRNHVMVFDTGPSFARGLDLGEVVVAPFLQYQGYRKINKLVVSHGDNDHIGGASFLLSNFSVQEVLTSVPQQIPESSACIRGQQWIWDQVHFKVLWPDSTKDWQGNDGSCVIRISSQYGSILLTGDIEKPAEHQLVSISLNDLESDVLQIPHQGSLTSSTLVFLNAVDPKLALVSTAYKNRYKHPHQRVIRRYLSRGVDLKDTAYTGAVSVTFLNSGMTVDSFRQGNPTIWRSQWMPEYSP